MERHVYLSYALADRDYAMGIADHFRSASVKVWYNNHPENGLPFPQDALQAIEASGATVVVLSADALESDWIRGELRAARDHGIPILGLLRETGLDVGPWVDGRTEDVSDGRVPPPSFDATLRDLVRSDGRSDPAPGKFGTDKHVFISHVSDDRAWADWVASRLRWVGYRVELRSTDWADAQDFVSGLTQELQRADIVVAIWSRQYIEGSYAMRALDAAAREGKAIVPVRIEEITPPARWRDLPSIDLFGFSQDEVAASERELYRAMLRNLGLVVRLPDPAAAADEAGPRLPGTPPEIWNVPARIKQFAGRGDLLVSLRARLEDQSACVLFSPSNSSGVGVSTLAVEYAHRFIGEYDLVWWIDARREESIVAGLADLARQTGLAVDAIDNQAAAEASIASLLLRERYLVIFDNAESDAVTSWLPSGPGHVVVTSRLALAGVDSSLPVHLPALPEAADMVRAWASDLSHEDAERIAAVMGLLPIGLAQAASLVRARRMDVSHYLNELNASANRKPLPATRSDYVHRFAAAVELTMAHLEQVSPVSVELVRICARLGPEPIPTWLLAATGNSGSPTLAAVAADSLGLDAALDQACDLGLLTRTAVGVSMHELTRAVLHEASDRDRDEPILSVIDATLARAQPDDGTDPSRWSRWAEILPHLLALEPATTRSDQMRGLACAAVTYLTRRGEKRTALGLADSLREAWGQRYGDNDPYTLRVSINLAVLYLSIQRPDDALELAQKAYERLQNIVADGERDTNRDIAAAVEVVVNALHALGRRADANAWRTAHMPKPSPTPIEPTPVVPVSVPQRAPTALHPLAEVFTLSGVPGLTYVEPDQFTEFQSTVAYPGLSVLLQGPSGIGKTTLLARAANGLTPPITMLNARNSVHVDLIRRLPEGHTGVVAIDDFHRLPADLRLRIADYMKVLADQGREEKLVLVGIPDTASNLIRISPDLASRLRIFALHAVTKDKIIDLIEKGERALNVRFDEKSEIVHTARRSLHIAQILCLQLCLLDGIQATQPEPKPKTIRRSVRAARTAFAEQMSLRYDPFVRGFCIGQPEIAEWCVKQLVALGASDEGMIILDGQDHGALKSTDLTDFLVRTLSPEPGSEEQTAMARLLTYDDTARKLIVDDPQFHFYLSQHEPDQLLALVGTASRDQVFISYSHADAGWLAKLRRNLIPLEGMGPIQTWEDTRIKPSDEWRPEIRTALARAQIAVLLISPEMLSSEFVRTVELPQLLKAARTGRCRLVALHLKRTVFNDLPELAQFQSFNDPAEPLAEMTPERADQVLADFAVYLARIYRAP